MRKIKTGKIKLKDIKHIENSRLRDVDEVSDMMQDIEQRGLLQSIGIRITDNALIHGNLRVRAYEKLGHEEIDCDFFDDMTDEDLLMANLAENMKRRNIGSIEIGRICKILKEKGMTASEIAIKLAVSVSRVKSSIKAYDITAGTPFEKLIVFGKLGPGIKGISESILWKISNSLTRSKRLTKDDWNILLNAVEQGKITTEHISMLRKILASEKNMSINRALDILEHCKILHIWFHLNDKEFNKAMKEEKFGNEAEFIRHIIRQYNPNLLF